ncbi:hypothetical protein [Phenylobacterium sp.]|jgi:hypothetical protein|uniref:hypothetical protein n=1 Tax=Phenylobacterium sp. TaxID=1871053 RepID=UPI002E343B0B|nr:hypothetical protein [Phenylobacterium sp.]HEX4710515.1 hypothetical protein [Phenylobacterium sp.]
MTLPIDPPRRASGGRLPSNTTAGRPDAPSETTAANLPVPVTPARTVPPRTAVGAAAIEAQLQGERRGLRGGAKMIEEAKVTYARTEWSGSKDRRRPKGRNTKTEI